MKRFITAILVFLFSVSSSFAEGLALDLSNATDSELSNAIQLIREEQVNRYKRNLAEQEIDADVDGISFRGIPWYSTLEYTEEQLGIVSKYKSAGKLYRIDYINSAGGYVGSDVVEGDLGCAPSYDLKVAGYQASSTRACFAFPIVEGQIVRDLSLAQLYMGYYTFKGDDFGDLTKVYEDLAGKLSHLYGAGVEAESSYYASITWTDKDGNYIRLRINSAASYMTLAYVAGSANQRLDEMAAAYINEKTLEDDALRNENINNTDGL